MRNQEFSLREHGETSLTDLGSSYTTKSWSKMGSWSQWTERLFWRQGVVAEAGLTISQRRWSLSMPSEWTWQRLRYPINHESVDWLLQGSMVAEAQLPPGWQWAALLSRPKGVGRLCGRYWELYFLSGQDFLPQGSEGSPQRWWNILLWGLAILLEGSFPQERSQCRLRCRKRRRHHCECVTIAETRL